MFLLDTNIVFELRKERPHGGVRAWADGIDPSDSFISAATMGEIERGIVKMEEHDPERSRAFYLSQAPSSAFGRGS
jgi:predicted nucleic acid-binding protein